MSDTELGVRAPHHLHCKATAEVPDVEGRLRRFMPLVLRAARHQWEMLGRRVDYGELVTAGALALLKAAEIHDERRSPFAGHLKRRLRWAMKDVARRRLGRRLDLSRGLPALVAKRYGDGNRRVRAPIDGDEIRTTSLFESDQPWVGTVCPTALPDEIAVSEDDGPEAAAIRNDLRAVLAVALRGLDEPQRTLLERHYFDGERFADVASELGISPFAACRLHKRALRALERVLRPVLTPVEPCSTPLMPKAPAAHRSACR